MIKEKRNLFENWRILAKTKKNRLRADKILVGYKKKKRIEEPKYLGKERMMKLRNGKKVRTLIEIK